VNKESKIELSKKMYRIIVNFLKKEKLFQYEFHIRAGLSEGYLGRMLRNRSIPEMKIRKRILIKFPKLGKALMNCLYQKKQELKAMSTIEPIQEVVYKLEPSNNNMITVIKNIRVKITFDLNASNSKVEILGE